MSFASLLGTSELQLGPRRSVSFSDTQYTDAIAAGGFENEFVNLYPIPGARVMVYDITIVSVDNLDWTLWFWGDLTFEVTGLLNARIPFTAADGRQLGGAGNFFYSLRSTTTQNPFPFSYVLNVAPSATVTSLYNAGFAIGLENSSGVPKTGGADTFAVNIMYIPLGEF